MLFGKFRILGKLALLVLVPLLGVVALSVPVVLNRVAAAADARETFDIVRLAERVSSAVQDLQEERLLSIGYYFRLVPQPDLVVQSAKADDAVNRLNHLDQPLPTSLRRAVANAASLNKTRQNVLDRAITPDVIINEFTGAVTPIIDGLDLRRHADLSTGVGRQVFALDQTLRSADQISQVSAWLTGAVAVRNFAKTESELKAAAGMISAFYSLLIQIESNIQSGQPYFTPAQYQLYLAAGESFSARVGTTFLVQVLTNPDGAIKTLNLATLFPSLQSANVLGGFVQKRIASDVNVAVAKKQQDALRTAYLVGGASLLLLLLVFALSTVMARAVARPLRRLTASADRIARAAETELERVADDDAETARPIRLDPVDVEARDEIGDLARAFDRVQTTAGRLVERQVAGRRNVAQMFGHVGRRTQNLVGRQLALIDNLERRETDSDRLRELYRLDHMSSRLRRNASSLVVLSGGAGTNEHVAPLPLSDVVRLALGEIEDYTRVDVDVPEEIVVVPAVVADLTLLLAELMENATSFSPPNTRITVTAAELRGGARLAVVDHGLGLRPERLAEENARLTRRERLDLAPTEVLGLFVVGRLARRHGIEVTLTDTPDGGLTAWVDLRPVHLVATAETIPVHATVGGHLTEFTPLLAGTANRSAAGSAQPFDANTLYRATRTLQAARSWNAFIPVRTAPALEAGPSGSSEPVYQAYAGPAYDEVPHDEEPPSDYDMGIPVAGRFPLVMEGPIVMPAPADAIQLPRQRNGSTQAPLRRRVPGSQLPIEAGTTLPAAPPSADDALAAREAFEAFEAGVTRAQWDVIEADASSPPALGHAPLTRRVPGASLPVLEPMNLNPPADPAQPLDPDAARALVEQFEYGVALAMKETQTQPEGQPR